MDDVYLPIYIIKNTTVFDRFTFDYLFKRLLADGYDNEEAKDIILHNCSFSTLVLQERLYNNYYLQITMDDDIAPDLLEIRRQELKKILTNPN
jgi:hypothetical protein